MILEEFVASLEYRQARWLENYLTQDGKGDDGQLIDVLEDFVNSFDFLTDEEAMQHATPDR